MSLDVTLKAVVETDVFDANTTHNLGSMARAAGIYYPLWRPEEIGLTKAGELIPFLEAGLKILTIDRDHLIREHEPENGWGTHAQFVPWVERYLEACREYPDAEIEVSR